MRNDTVIGDKSKSMGWCKCSSEIIGMFHNEEMLSIKLKDVCKLKEGGMNMWKNSMCT